MMEFFLSKIWLFVCGIAVTSVLVMAFSGMDHSVTDDESQRRAAQLSDALDSVSDSPDRVQIEIKVADYLSDGHSSVLISKGYICIESGNVRSYAVLHSSTVMKDSDGNFTDGLTLVDGDVMMISKDPARRDAIMIQVAKERTVSLTA